MSGVRSARLLPAQQQCLFAIRTTHNYVTRFPGEEFKPEILTLTVKHLLKIMIWCCMARSEVGHCRWNCQCDQMHWYTAEVRGAISIALFQKAYQFCLKDGDESCHLAKLVSNWKGQNNTRTLTSPAQPQDWNRIENLWHKITLEIIKRHRTIKRKLIDPPGTGESPTTTSSRCPLNSDTMLKSNYKQRLTQNILTRQVNVYNWPCEDHYMLEKRRLLFTCVNR